MSTELPRALATKANIKKYVIGTKKVNGFSEPNNSGVNTYMLRLAEVYLNYVEATMGNADETTDPTALHYFNLIRQRAKMPEKNVVTYEDLRHEFRMEFAFEGLYWYELLRRGYYHQQKVVNYLNSQNRNASYFDNATKTYKLSDSYVAPVLMSTLPQPRISSFRCRIPIRRRTRTSNLMPAETSPRSFEFGEREVDEQSLFE